jgi:hypothetical protein
MFDIVLVRLTLDIRVGVPRIHRDWMICAAAASHCTSQLASEVTVAGPGSLSHGHGCQRSRLGNLASLKCASGPEATVRLGLSHPSHWHGRSNRDGVGLGLTFNLLETGPGAGRRRASDRHCSGPGPMVNHDSELGLNSVSESTQ